MWDLRTRRRSRKIEEIENGKVIVSSVKYPDKLQCWGIISSRSIHDKLTEHEWDQVGVGHDGACAVSMDSQILCWGGNADTQMTPTNDIVVH